MSVLAHIGVMPGETPAARAVAGAVISLLTAVGRWVDAVPPGADPAGYAALVLPGGRGWRAVRAAYAGPLLVVDADLLDGAVDPEFAPLLTGAPEASIAVRETRVLLPRPLPALAGRPLGDAPPAVVVGHAPGLGYALPVVLAPALRTVAGFWSLARALEEGLAALIGEERPLYADPWPRGFRAARALTYDLDGLEQAALPSVATEARPATLFCCADALARLGTLAPGVEVAAHGDVHRPFLDARTNLERVERMLTTFRAAGLAPRGFSPPNLAYSSTLSPLLERFGYLRLGYQERALRFFPAALEGGLVVPVSYYPDFLHRYVGAEEYARLLGRFAAWAAATSAIFVPCFHPCLWDEPLRRFLAEPAPAVWETTLSQACDWWAHRRRALAAIAAADEGAAPPDVALARATPAARVAALRPVNGEPGPAVRLRHAGRVVVGGRGFRVVPAADGPAAAVDIPLGPAWRPLGWLPGAMRRAASRALLRVSNKNGLHACLYGDLGLAPEVVGGALRLPVVAADEPLMVTHPGSAEVRRAVGAVVRRLVRPETAHA
jgi:hypothetical protein